MSNNHLTTRQSFLRLPQILEITGLGKTKIYGMIKLNQFPAPKKIGRVSVWLNSDIENWLTTLNSASPD